MENTHYYLERGHCNMMKSKLHAAIDRYFASLSGTLIVAGELETMKHIFTEKVHSLNAEFKRCKPVELRFNSYSLGPETKKIIAVNGIDGMSFSIKPGVLLKNGIIKLNL